MFDTDVLNLMEEIQAAEKLRDSHLSVLDSLVERYHGKFYRGDVLDTEPSPENHAFEWISLITPQVIHDNPRVEVTSRGSGLDPAPVARLKHAINQWAYNNDLWKKLQEVWYDMAFSYGVLRVTLATLPGYYTQSQLDELRYRPMMPVVSRVDPKRFVCDARAETIDHCRFQGHMWKRDKEDLLGAPGFNRSAVEELIADAGIERYDKNKKYGPDRKEIVGYELWIPEITLPEVQGDDQFNGTLYTLAYAQAGEKRSEPKWIRDPRPYYGPPTGPYQMFGVYRVPGFLYPLSPLMATAEQEQELNAHAVAAARSAASFKKFIAYDPANKEAGIAVQQAQHGSVVAIPGLGEDIEELTQGGNDQSQLEYLIFLRERRDRVTGLNEAARGEISGRGTATETADAASARRSRLDFVERQFTDSTEGTLDKVGWFMFNSEHVRFPLGQAAVAELAPRPDTLPPMSQAGKIARSYDDPFKDDPMGLRDKPLPERENIIRSALEWNPTITFPSDRDMDLGLSMAEILGITYEQLELSIEPMSMARTDQGMLQKRALDQFQLVVQSAPIMPQTPWVRWGKILEDIGNSLNVKGFGQVIDEEMLRKFQQGQGAMAESGMGGQPQQLAPMPGPPNEQFADERMQAVVENSQQLAEAAQQGGIQGAREAANYAGV